jgi:tetratricopeptide (TPR) repeat protein
LAATLAYHYARTDLVDEAVRWLIRAADRAAQLYANAEAVLHLDLAARRLQRLPEGPDRDRRMLQVALRHAHSLYFLGRFRESVEVLLPHEAPLARLDEPALTAAYSFWLAHMHSRLGDQHRACDNAARAIAAATRAGDEETLGKAHGLLTLEGHWSGNTADGIAHGRKSVDLLRAHPQQRWWLGMTHFYLAMNHLVQGDFEAALAEANRADAIGQEIGDPRLQTYAAFTVGWVEATRRNDTAAVAACQRSLEQAPDRVSRAYASMVLGLALVGQGDHDQARTILEPMVAELKGFALPQWHGLAATLTAETYRLGARLDVAGTVVERALDLMTRAQYGYGDSGQDGETGRNGMDTSPASPTRRGTAARGTPRTAHRANLLLRLCLRVTHRHEQAAVVVDDGLEVRSWCRVSTLNVRKIFSARRISGSASPRRLVACSNCARLWRCAATTGCASPSLASSIASARRSSGSASPRRLVSCSKFARLLRGVATSGCASPYDVFSAHARLGRFFGNGGPSISTWCFSNR